MTLMFQMGRYTDTSDPNKSITDNVGGCTFVLEIMDSSHFTVYPHFFGITIHFVKGKSDINIDKDRYKNFG